MRRSAGTEPSGPSLLVAQTSFLGDVVLTTPLLSALRRRLAPVSLDVLVRPDAVPLVTGHPAVDHVLVDDKRGADAGAGGLVRLARRLRARGYDVVVSPHRSLRTALALAMAGIPRRVGFGDSRGAWLFHRTVRRERTLHDVHRNLALLEAFGGDPGPLDPALPVSAAARAAAADMLPAGSGPLVGLAAGSVWATKRWSSEGFAAVAAALTDDGARCVVLGAPEDRERAAVILARTGQRATSLIGRTDIATLVATIAQLDLLIANDSAPMHIASALGVPVVAIFCATTPALGYGPWGPRSIVVEAPLDCRPCRRHGSQACPRGTEDCIRLVSPHVVVDAARTLLAGRRAA